VRTPPGPSAILIAPEPPGHLYWSVVHRTIAGIVVGAVAAAIVLGVDGLFTRFSGGTGFHPLLTVELKTYDWRLARTARPSTARRDLVLVEIDEYSLRNLQPNAGRWPWPRVVHALLLDYLARAPAAVIAYDVNFAESDTRIGFKFGGSAISGEESDQALAENHQSF